jgi:uncharacterized membrane protein YkvA (DUF1232 family)
MKDNKETVSNDYSKAFSDTSLFDKIIKNAQKAGISVVYAGLLLFYTLKKPSIPGWARATIISSLGYFISPIDAIPDLAPVIGYTDDLGVLIVALATVAIFIDEEVKKKSKEKLKGWFRDYNDSAVKDIDDKVNKR